MDEDRLYRWGLSGGFGFSDGCFRPIVLRTYVRVEMRRLELEQQVARQLRHEGSLREIAWKLEVSLSSVSVWVRGIPAGGESAGREQRTPVEEEQLSLEELRRCSRCERHLPESRFNRHPTGRQWWCRECFKGYFRDRGRLHRTQTAVSKARRRSEAKDYMTEYLAKSACKDCGACDEETLEFDHLGDKRREVSVMRAMGYSLQALREEIAKCEVVCVNCHRRRTARRAGWRRAFDPWWKSPPPKRYETARNLAYVYSFLERSKCVDCGLADLVVLEFDHLRDKRSTVSKMAQEGVGLVRLQAEISKCVVRCANCHRRRTRGQLWGVPAN